MQRAHLEEDLHLIQKYFPGAKPVALHTPFDLTDRLHTTGSRSGTLASTFRDDEPNSPWYGDFSWSR